LQKTARQNTGPREAMSIGSRICMESMSKQAGARIFRITVDGLTRAYRLTAVAAGDLAAVIKAKSPRCEVAVRDVLASHRPYPNVAAADGGRSSSGAHEATRRPEP